jgi:hypothetical protein
MIKGVITFATNKKIRQYRRSKRNLQRVHFVKRMFERHGWRITDNDYEVIRRMIQSGQTTCIGRQSLRTTAHILCWNDKNVIVFYDTARGQPVTVLADGMIPALIPVSKESDHEQPTDENPEPADAPAEAAPRPAGAEEA